jgi:phosphocarrier protein HPr
VPAGCYFLGKRGFHESPGLGSSGGLRILEASVTRSVIVINRQGFHARPAHLFVKLAASFPCQVQILKGNEVIDGKSILELLTLGAGNGTTLTLRACGDSADAAVEALAKLIEGGFGEMTPAEGST